MNIENIKVMQSTEEEKEDDDRQSVIYIYRGTDRSRFIKAVFEHVSELTWVIKKSRKILLKPNVVSYENYPTTTHPTILRTCIEACNEISNSELIVADGPAPDAGDSRAIITRHQLNSVCQEFGLELTDLITSKMVQKRTEFGFELEFALLPLTVDCIISLPVLKSHLVTVLTGALKNQFGLLSRSERYKLHSSYLISRRKDIHKAIAGLNSIVKPDFFIVDAVQTLVFSNEVRHGGKLANLGYMLAGNDPVALDSFGLTLLQKVDTSQQRRKASDIRHLKYAEELKLGTSTKFKIIELH